MVDFAAVRPLPGRVVEHQKQPAIEAADRELGALIVSRTQVTCPTCGHVADERMPADACVFRYTCKQCSTQIESKDGLCIFCSFGSVPCPPVQVERLGLEVGPQCCQATTAAR